MKIYSKWQRIIAFIMVTAMAIYGIMPESNIIMINAIENTEALSQNSTVMEATTVQEQSVAIPASTTELEHSVAEPASTTAQEQGEGISQDTTSEANIKSDVSSRDNIMVDVENKIIILNGNPIILQANSELEKEDDGYANLYIDENQNGKVDSEDTLFASDGDAILSGYLKDYDIYGSLSDEKNYDVNILVESGCYNNIYAVKDAQVKDVTIKVCNDAQVNCIIANYQGYVSGNIDIELTNDCNIEKMNAVYQGFVDGNIKFAASENVAINDVKIVHGGSVKGKLKVSLNAIKNIPLSYITYDNAECSNDIEIMMNQCRDMTFYGVHSSVVKGNVSILGSIYNCSVTGAIESDITGNIEIEFNEFEMTEANTVKSYILNLNGIKNGTLGGSLDITLDKVEMKTSVMGASNSSIIGSVSLNLSEGKFNEVIGATEGSNCKNVNIYSDQCQHSNTLIGVRDSKVDNPDGKCINMQLYSEISGTVYGIYACTERQTMHGDIYIRHEQPEDSYYDCVINAINTPVDIIGDVQLHLQGIYPYVYGVRNTATVTGDVKVTMKNSTMSGIFMGICEDAVIDGNVSLTMSESKVTTLYIVNSATVKKEVTVTVPDSNTKISYFYGINGTVEGNYTANIKKLNCDAYTYMNQGTIKGDMNIIYSNVAQSSCQFYGNYGLVEGDCSIVIKQGYFSSFTGNQKSIKGDYSLLVDYMEESNYMYCDNGGAAEGQLSGKITIDIIDGIFKGNVTGVSRSSKEALDIDFNIKGGNYTATQISNYVNGEDSNLIMKIAQEAVISTDTTVSYNTSKTKVNGYLKQNRALSVYGNCCIRENLDVDTIEVEENATLYLSKNKTIKAESIMNNGKICNQGEITIGKYTGEGEVLILDGNLTSLTVDDIRNQIQNIYYVINLSENERGAVYAVNNAQFLTVDGQKFLFGKAGTEVTLNVQAAKNYRVAFLSIISASLEAIETNKVIDNYQFDMPEEKINATIQYTEKECADVDNNVIYVDTIEQTVHLYGNSVVIAEENGDTTIYLDQDKNGQPDEQECLYSGDLSNYSIIGIENSEVEESIVITMRGGTIKELCGIKDCDSSKESNLKIVVEDGTILQSLYGISNCALNGSVYIENQLGNIGCIEVMANTVQDNVTQGYAILDKSKLTIGGKYKISESIEAETIVIAENAEMVLPKNIRLASSVLDVEGMLTVEGEVTAHKCYSKNELWIQESGSITVEESLVNSNVIYVKGSLKAEKISSGTSTDYIMVMGGEVQNDNYAKMYYPIQATLNSEAITECRNNGITNIKQYNEVNYGCAGKTINYKYDLKKGYQVNKILINEEALEDTSTLFSFTMPQKAAEISIFANPCAIEAKTIADNPVSYVGQVIEKSNPLYDMSSIQIKNDSEGDSQYYELEENSYMPEGLILEDNCIYGTPKKAYPEGLDVSFKCTGNNGTSDMITITITIMDEETEEVTVNNELDNIIVDTETETIDFNGQSVVVMSNPNDSTCTDIYLDKNQNGIADSTSKLTIGNSSLSDLSSYALYGCNSEQTLVNQRITFDGGNIGAFYAVGENGVLNGNIEIVVNNISANKLSGVASKAKVNGNVQIHINNGNIIIFSGEEESAVIDGNLDITIDGGWFKYFYGVCGKVTDGNIDIKGGILNHNTYMLYHGEADNVTANILDATFSDTGKMVGALNAVVNNNFVFTVSKERISREFIGIQNGEYKNAEICATFTAVEEDLSINGITDATIHGDAKVCINEGANSGEKCIITGCNNTEVSGNLLVDLDWYAAKSQVTAIAGGSVKKNAGVYIKNTSTNAVYTLNDGAEVQGMYSIIRNRLKVETGCPELIEDSNVYVVNVETDQTIIIPENKQLTVSDCICNDGTIRIQGEIITKEIYMSGNSEIYNYGILSITSEYTDIHDVVSGYGNIYSKGKIIFTENKLMAEDISNAYFYHEVISDDAKGSYKITCEEEKYKYIEQDGEQELYILQGSKVNVELIPKDGYVVSDACYYGNSKQEMELVDGVYSYIAPACKTTCVISFSKGQIELAEESDEAVISIGTIYTIDKPIYDISKIEIKNDEETDADVEYMVSPDSELPEGLQFKNGMLYGEPQMAYPDGTKIKFLIIGKNGSKCEFTLELTIQKLIPEYEEVGTLYAEEGTYLNQITLPKGFVWENASLQLTECGMNTYYVKYQKDTARYEVVRNIPVTISVTCKEHDFSDWDIEQEASCAHAGLQSRICNKCGLEEKSVIERESHSWGKWTITKNVSCEESGYKECECKACGAVKQVSITALGHSYSSEQTIEKVATCKETGIISYPCEREGCNATANPEEIPMLEHVYSTTEEYKEASCTEKGYYTYLCEGCKEHITVEIPALGHDADENWVVKQKANTEDNGLKVRCCSREGCEDVAEQVSIPKMVYAVKNTVHLSDHQSHNLTIEVTTPKDAIVQYSTDGEHYSDVLPVYSEPGRYPVYYKIEHEEYETCYGQAVLRIFQSLAIEDTEIETTEVTATTEAEDTSQRGTTAELEGTTQSNTETQSGSTASESNTTQEAVEGSTENAESTTQPSTTAGIPNTTQEIAEGSTENAESTTQPSTTAGIPNTTQEVAEGSTENAESITQPSTTAGVPNTTQEATEGSTENVESTTQTNTTAGVPNTPQEAVEGSTENTESTTQPSTTTGVPNTTQGATEGSTENAESTTAGVSNTTQEATEGSTENAESTTQISTTAGVSNTTQEATEGSIENAESTTQTSTTAEVPDTTEGSTENAESTTQPSTTAGASNTTQEAVEGSTENAESTTQTSTTAEVPDITEGSTENTKSTTQASTTTGVSGTTQNADITTQNTTTTQSSATVETINTATQTGNDTIVETDKDTGENYNQSAKQFTKKGITYTILKNTKKTKTVAVTGIVNPKTKNVKIPKTVSYQGTKFKVSKIQKNAFKNASLKSLTVGKNVRNIGKNAFYGCKNLKRITIRSKKVKIHKTAFRKISKKAVITLPKAVKKKYHKMLKQYKVRQG